MWVWGTALTVQRIAGLKRVVAVAAGEKHSLALVRAAMPEEPAQGARLEQSNAHGTESGRAERGVHAESSVESSDEEGADDEWMMMAGMDMDDDATVMRDDGFAASQADRIRAVVTRQVQPKPSPTSKGRRCARGGDGGAVPRLSALAEAAACRGLNLRSVGYLLAAACSLGAHHLKASSMQMLMGNLDALLELGGADLLLDMPEEMLQNLEAHRATQGPCRASRCLSTHRRAAAEEQGADGRREERERLQQLAEFPQHAQRTLRTLRKKLREAEGLAARAEAGQLLDAHQQGAFLETDGLNSVESQFGPSCTRGLRLPSSTSQRSWHGVLCCKRKFTRRSYTWRRAKSTNPADRRRLRLLPPSCRALPALPPPRPQHRQAVAGHRRTLPRLQTHAGAS